MEYLLPVTLGLQTWRMTENLSPFKKQIENVGIYLLFKGVSHHQSPTKTKAEATEAVCFHNFWTEDLSFHNPFTLPVWDENKFIQNRKHSFSNSSSESKLSLFIHSQVSWNYKHKLTLDTCQMETGLV